MAERIYVIAGGPSLKRFNFDKLKDEKCIAVTESFYSLKSLVGLVALDSIFYTANYDSLHGQKFPMYAVKNYDPSKQKKRLGVIELENTGVNGVELGDGIRHGFNSAYTAIGIAIKTGIKDIRVLGMDLTDTGHYHNLRPDYDFSYVIKHLAQLKKELPKDIKITFYGKTNANMFENKPLSECLI